MTDAEIDYMMRNSWLSGRDAAVAKVRSLAELYRAYYKRHKDTDPERARSMWDHAATLEDAAMAIESGVKPSA